MRITFIAPVMDLSGGARVIHIYAKSLRERGHQVCLVTRPRLLSFRKRVRSLVSGQGWPDQASYGPTHFDSSAYDLRIVDAFQPVSAVDVPDADVVIATWWETAEWIATFPPEKGKKVHFVQGYEAFPGMPKDRVHAVLRAPNFKITISRWLEDLLRNDFGNEAIVRIPNSVDTKQFNAPPRDRKQPSTIGMIYSPHPVKDCATGLRAIALLRKRLPNVRLLAFGKSAPPISLRLERGSQFVFSPDQKQIPALYGACDVWLCSSKEEGFGLPVLEAMACRCPSVSTAVGGATDFISDGVNGLLAPIGDAASLANAMEKVLTIAEADWRAMSDAAYLTATHYSWDDAADLFQRALDNLL